MTPLGSAGAASADDLLEVLWQGADRRFCRLRRGDAKGDTYAFIPCPSGVGQPLLESIERLKHEYELRDQLDSTWALRPTELVLDRERTMLLVGYTAGEPLDRLTGRPMEVGRFLRLAVNLAGALRQLHASGLIHKDIKPANVLVDHANERVWLTGFGIASRLPRERQSPQPAGFIAGTLAYMAPEQTGRMNRSIDSRSDLYALGVTFYELLTGSLPFTASDPLQWVHCHVAREPMPVIERLPGIPASLSAITMKLLSKTAEQRYQTAGGVEADLRRCLHEWQLLGRIHDFRPGDCDTPDRLKIPEKLYGRDGVVATLLAAFDRVASGGVPELVLVSGYSGVGKSAVVEEVHKSLVASRATFASGKFDQYKREIPYATLAQAFQALVRALLTKTEDDLYEWRRALAEALDRNGALMIDLVPELRHIVGEQSPVPDLPPRDAQERFRQVLRHFIQVFARPERPLVLFLDDLQWLDEGTRELLEYLLIGSDLRYLLLIGAFRDNEVDSSHPLMRKLEVIREAGGVVRNVALAPLGCDDVVRLLADSLRCDADCVDSLARLIYEKTNGNPLFVIQFFFTLADEELLTFDYGSGRWSWDLKRISSKGYTDNVVHLMVAKLARMPIETQRVLQLFACVGSSASVDLLQMIYQDPVERLQEGLLEAARSGMIIRSEESYEFVHDRVQEAAYSLIAPEQRAATHLRIGRLWVENTAPGKLEDAIFEIVNQLNRGAKLVVSIGGRETLAYFNLTAARRAKSAAVYAVALQYGRAGAALLTDQTWERNYELIFSIEYLIAECEMLTGDVDRVAERLSRLAACARCRHDFCTVTRLRLALYVTLDQSDRAVDVFLDWLGRDGIVWSARPTDDDVKREYDRIWLLLGTREIEDVVDLPLIGDPDVLDTMGVFGEMVTPSWGYDQNLSTLVVCRLVTLSLEYGNCDSSCFAYVWLAMLAGQRFCNYQVGVRFGQLGVRLVEDRGLTRYQARTYMSLGALVVPWVEHPSSGRELVRRASDAAYRIGDLTFAAYCRHQLITMSLAAGDPLADVQEAAEEGLAFTRRARFGLLNHICGTQLGLIRTLRGSAVVFGNLDNEDFSESETEQVMADNRNLGLAEFFYWTRKCQSRFFSADYASAIEASMRAKRLLWLSHGMFETAELHFFSALAHALACEFTSSDQLRLHVDALKSHRVPLELWAEHNPTTFQCRALLTRAELARVEGRPLEAEELYEKAIGSAQKHGFVHVEAIANELAARFYLGRDLQKIGDAYMREACYCYRRWGAEGKAREIEDHYPALRGGASSYNSAATIEASAGSLDLARAIELSETVAGEIVLDKLIDALMRTAIEHAGADRGLLILSVADRHTIEAEVASHSDGVKVTLRRATVTAQDMPESVLRYVLRTRQSVLLNDAARDTQFGAADYVREQGAQSILCLPILKQTRMLGVLYLENRLTRHAFTAARMTILKLLAAQAAISIENAALYRDVAQREARIRRLVDANIIGIIIWDIEGRIREANEAFLSMLGYDREDLTSGRLSWRDLTPPEWLELDLKELVPKLRLTGSLRPFEKEFFRKDGSRVPILAGVATFEEGGNEGVAFVIDLTERRRDAEALRELQMQLAHANRLATMGQLAASIAHEVNQPIGAAHNNARAALRFLAADPPDLPEVAEALQCVVHETYRSGDIIGRIRNHVKKGFHRRESVDIDRAIDDVIALVRGELSKHHVTIQTRFEEELRPVHGDRVELQQVMLNLILNGMEAMCGVAEEKRELLITTETSAAGMVLVAVCDSGPGVPLQERERIFNAFYTTKTDGIGIGLSICRSIVEAHGGRLWVDAHHPCGAAFRFSLPQAQGR